MKLLQPGECLHRIACDEPVIAQGDGGEEVVTFPTEAFTLWAKIEPLSGRERLVANQTIAEGTTRVRVFWSANAARINAKWRLRHRDIVYNISGPPSEIDMGRREIEILCTSGLNRG